MDWFSEAEKLPEIAETVMLASPRSSGDFWDLRLAMILVRHEGVVPMPVPNESKTPVDFYWAPDGDIRKSRLVTGRQWWARLDTINLPPGAEHARGRRGEHFIRQTVSAAPTEPVME